MSKSLTLNDILENRVALLEKLLRKQKHIRDRVRGVALQYDTGLYLHGRPGTAKTFSVRSVLEDEIKETYLYERGHITPIGLFNLLSRNPEDLIVLDDMGAILRNEVALQILLAALEHPDPQSKNRDRIVNYRRHDREEHTLFRGGLICVSNRSLHEDELLEAFKSRTQVLKYDPTDAELGALMLDIADGGWPAGAETPEIDPESAHLVANFVMTEMLRLSIPFDLRLLVNKAFPTYQQWKDEETELDWQDLVTASLEQEVLDASHPVATPKSREARKQEECAIMQEILLKHESPQDRITAWVKLTRKSPRAYYRRLAQLK